MRGLLRLRFALSALWISWTLGVLCGCSTLPRDGQDGSGTHAAPAVTRHAQAGAPGLQQEPQSPAAPPANLPEDIGTLRNARVAVERPPGHPPLTYFARSLSEAERAELTQLAPGIRFVVGLSQEQAEARAAEADAADGSYATPAFLARAGRLVWMQAHSAGVDHYLGLDGLMHNDRIVLTNMRGVHGPAIADHAFAMLLALTRDLPVFLADRAEGRWRREGSGVLQPMALQGRTMLVVGLGGIGGEIARRAHGFGMHVLATRRDAGTAPDYVEKVGKPEELRALLPQADVVAIAVPLTPETEHLFDRAAFGAMKPGSFLINVARGPIVDTAALLEALQSGRLAGACLDVTDPEPLPPDHPLWRLPNVVITPHVASAAELTDERAWILWRENLRRFDAGEPLLNVVDKAAGY